MLGLSTDINVIGVTSNSGVSRTPLGDDEAIEGCLNRIAEARTAYATASFIVGMEGVIERRKFGTFVYGWAIIEHRATSFQALGCSAKVMLPHVIAESVTANNSLSQIVSDHYGIYTAETVAEIGTNGVLTNGLFTRRDEFESALRCALGFLLRRL